jgi:hypothetical protein
MRTGQIFDGRTGKLEIARTLWRNENKGTCKSSGLFAAAQLASERLFRECILKATVHAKSTVGQRLKPTNAKFLS